MAVEFKRQHWMFASFSFLFSFIVYFLTVSPTVSYWDCGEFIASAYVMGIPHPPGAPLFMIVGRVASLFAPSVQYVAYSTNLLSVLSSAFAVFFMHLSVMRLFSEWKGVARDANEFYFRAIASVIASLMMAFCHTVWFSAVETEMYAHHILMTSLMVWLTLKWSEIHEDESSDRYLLMIAYLMGLASGVHIATLLSLPFVSVIYYNKKYKDKNFIGVLISGAIGLGISLLIFPGVIKYFPKLILQLGSIYWGGIIIFALVAYSVYLFSSNSNRILRLSVMSLTLICLGYSTYATIYIRSNLNPTLDENDPETLESFIAYIGREQYGDMTTFPRRWNVKSQMNGKVWANNGQAVSYRDQANQLQRITSVEQKGPNSAPFENFSVQMEYLWSYQLRHMLFRYMGWNFVGVPDGEKQDEPSDPSKLFFIPLILILLGAYIAFKYDTYQSWAIFAMWFMSGIALQLYLNQNEPQPRERDYSLVVVFYAMTIWGAYAVYFLLHKMKEITNNNIASYAMAVILFLLAPLNMLAKNYHSHDRSENYVAWDYSYNILISCEENAILFTNGDNDTFPIWYLQLVEGIRPDVTAVNLSLVNTPWYIYQHKSGQLGTPAPITFSDKVISAINPERWDTKKIKFKVPKTIFENELKERLNQNLAISLDKDTVIDFDLPPQMNYPTGQGTIGLLRVQDIIALHIITENKWKRPINWAVTVGNSNLLGGLKNYMRMDGLVYKLTSQKDWSIDPEILEDLLVNKYRYRNLDNPNVFYNDNIEGLIQNVRTAFMQLAQVYARESQSEKEKDILVRMNELIDPNVIPIQNKAVRIFIDLMTKFKTDNEFNDQMFNEYSTDEVEYIWQSAHQMNKNLKLRNYGIIEHIKRLGLRDRKKFELARFLLTNMSNITEKEYYKQKIVEQFKDDSLSLSILNKM